MNTASMNYSELRIMRNRMNRNKELKRRISLFFISLLIILITFMIFKVASVNAQDMNNKTLFKYYKSVQVQAGDTLESIAENNLTSKKYNKNKLMKEIVFINNIEDEDFLLTGSYIIVPYYDEYRG